MLCQIKLLILVFVLHVVMNKSCKTKVTALDASFFLSKIKNENFLQYFNGFVLLLLFLYDFRSEFIFWQSFHKKHQNYFICIKRRETWLSANESYHACHWNPMENRLSEDSSLWHRRQFCFLLTNIPYIWNRLKANYVWNI